MAIRFKLLISMLTLVLCACSADNRLLHADQIAQRGHLTQLRIAAGQFVLNTYSHINNPSQPINVYIEGDGFAWLNKYQISSDPTPRHALALQLASLDTAENVLYIARPCQFHDFSAPTCDNAYWADKRFAEEVIVSVNQALDYFAKQLNQPEINLIGYSGGGAIAVLVAARRTDITSLRTVAGNLDHTTVNQYHSVNAMPQSLNPLDVAAQIKSIPQIHFIGAQDKRIPASIAAVFLARQQSNCATIINVTNADHEHGWTETWRDLLQKTPKC